MDAEDSFQAHERGGGQLQGDGLMDWNLTLVEACVIAEDCSRYIDPGGVEASRSRDIYIANT